MLIFYMCVFLILHPAYKYSFLKHINGARLQSSAGTSAPCHQLCSSWDPNWGWHGSSTRRAALLSGLGDIPNIPIWHQFAPLSRCGAVGVPWGSAVPVAHPALLCVNKHKTKRKSCQFLDPSPLYFHFLAVPVAAVWGHLT